MTRRAATLLTPALLMLAGCRGVVGEGPVGPRDVPPMPRECVEGESHAVGVPLRRLTAHEYQAALIALFGPEVPDVRADYPAAPPGEYDYSTYPGGLEVGEREARALLELAERVAEHVAPSLPVCAGRAPDQCAREALAPLATRAFRRPVEDADLERLVGVAAGAAAEGLAPNEAIAIAVVALLQEPRFLYVLESRPGEERWTLDGHERAQRLALALWSELPDAMLLERAASGALDSRDGMRAEGERMLDDPRARATFHRFVREWLGIAALPQSHSPEVRAALDEELTRLIDEAWTADDALFVLLRADTAYADAVLEELYGVDAGSTGPGDFRRIAMPGARVGVMTHPLVLAAASHGESSSPILRGKLVQTRVACTPIPPPFAGAQEMEPQHPAGATARQRYEARNGNPTCAACHVRLDPVGFALERFDGLGRLRTEIDGQPIDEAGEMLAAGDAAGSFVGPEELGDHLVGSEEVTRCFARQWTRYALGREDGADLACAQGELGAEFARSGRSARALLEAFTESDVLVERTDEVSR